MQRVVVIGADGFVGSKLSAKLIDAGYDVMALIFAGSDKRINIDNTKLITYEFTFNTLYSINANGYDTIYNMAWAGVDSINKNDIWKQSQNILYGLKVIDWAKENMIQKIIFPGSASENSCGYGIITGKEMPAPSDMYAACKAATRVVCMKYAEQVGINLIWSLITSIYGPGRNDNNLISYTIKSLLNGNSPNFTGLEQIWDYIYIDDLIAALIALGEKGIGGKIYPVGSGESKSMRQYVELIRDLINPSLKLGIGKLPYKDPHKIDNQKLNITDLKKDTGFQPKYDFMSGIIKTIDYYKTLNF